MPVNLSKVQKKIIKKKGKDALHENSRDSRQLRRAGAREEKLSQAARVTMRARQGYVNRVEFFQEQLPEDVSSFTMTEEEMHALTDRYLARVDEEISTLTREQRKNRPPPKRLLDLQETRAAELKEFETGFWVPDLTDETSARRLKAWNGEWSALSAIKFARLLKAGGRKESSFPPRGLS
ncbi:hypothetical protein KEM52_005217 [Ascosphaera acerosa]|nr:hypothetical protein KEM52_005217 [Ascosphaera acerosa]